MYLKNRDVFLYWYSSALALIVINLSASLMNKAAGSPIGWTARFSQYLAGIYLVIAIKEAIRSAQSRRISFDNVLAVSFSPIDEKFRALAEHSPDIIDRFDREMRHIYVNSEGLRLYGKPAGSIIGKTIEETGFSEAYCSLWRGRIQKVFETGQPMEVEDYLPTEHGTRFYLSHCAPEYGADGVVANVLVVSRDLTERKQVEEALHKAHERAVWLARFPEQNPNPIIRVSADGTVLYCNPASAKLHGWTCEVGGMLQNQLLPLVGRAMAEGREVNQDVQLDGRFYFVWIAPFPAEGYANVYARDITERKRAEDALRSSMERLGLALEASNSGAWEWDLRTNENVWSEELWKVYGLQPHSCKPSYEAWRQTIHPGERAKTEQAVQQAAHNGTELNAEWRVRDPSGTERWLMSRGRPVREANGEVVRYVGIVTDITERKRAELALRNSEARFKLLSETAGKLLSTGTPQGIVNELCRDVMAHLDCEVFFNFLVDDEAGRLHLNAYAGIPEEEARKIEWLDYGVAVSGCAARDGAPIIAENISNTPDPRTDLVRSFGIQAYACHPLMVRGRLIGTLSFGTKTRLHFSIEDLALMRTVTDQVAVAMERMRLVEELERSRKELEIRVRERTAELAIANESLRQLSMKLISTQEEERKRVAVDIHDSLGACLSAIKFKVQDVLQRTGKTAGVSTESLKTVLPVIQEGIEECRRIQMDLRPSLLDDLGLLATLSWFFRRFQTIYSKIQIEQEIEIEESDISPSLRVVIFRVTQEALNNIAKHSEASLVRLSLRKLDDRIDLVLQDNGRGFHVEKVLSRESIKKGLGLTSMKERTELSGGSFAIESAEGKGTTIRAWWPLH